MGHRRSFLWPITRWLAWVVVLGPLRLAYERLRSMCVMHGILVHEPTKKPQAWCRLRLYRHDHADCLS